jgi:hypothetical protein
MPECESCHGNHEILPATRDMLGTSHEAVCSTCHSETDRVAGHRAAAVMRQLADSLAAAEDSARALLNEAEQKGMEVSEARFKLRDARQARLESRTVLHAFDEARFREVASKGLGITAVVHAEARHALDEYVFRRVGLGIATLIITILAGALYFYIRRIERAASAAAKES